MNSPDWAEAPIWAEYHAYDADGSGFFFEHEPRIYPLYSQWGCATGRVYPSPVIGICKHWRTSLTRHPLSRAK